MEKVNAMNDKEKDYEDGYKEIEEGDTQVYQAYLKNAYPSYTLERHLGRGGFAEVFACRDSNFFDELRAVKVIRLQEFNQDKKMLEIGKIRNEFALQYFFRDVSVRIYGYPSVDKDDQFFCVSMEIMDGTLRDILKRHHNCFDAVDTVRIMKEVSLLVEKLHNNKEPLPESIRMEHTDTSVAHFDLKPENIFYKTEHGKLQFKLGDYGCSRLADATQSRIRGTEKYMSLTPSEEPGCARDIYALGIIMMELQGAEISLQERFEPQTMWEHTEVPVDRDLRDICRKACSRHPEERYTIDEFIQELDHWLEAHADDVLIKEGDVDALLRKAASLVGSEDAEKYYEAAAEKGSGKAAYCLYQLLKDTAPERAEEFLEKAEKMNYAPAVNEYVCKKIKDMGPDGSLQDMAETAELLRPVSSELPAAAYNLALFMKAGMIAEKSEGEADQLLKKAADSHFQAAVRLVDVLNHEITVQE
ncbi:MAG: protein kinase [Lachnospiraceae bacterium]|nr:protein kinase [Lachnospiraceae bacterium]MDY4970443.1 protein kinase [Lachnospiraceae bacterium]